MSVEHFMTPRVWHHNYLARDLRIIFCGHTPTQLENMERT